jgi:hypothetical protein
MKLHASFGSIQRAAFAIVVALLANFAAAQCPFSVSGLPNLSAASDGLLFIRAAANVAAINLTPGTGTQRSGQDVLSFIATSNARLDVNGSGAFDAFDAAIITRYLFGFLDDRLVLPNEGAGPGATRDATQILAYIQGGCAPPIVNTRSGYVSYYFNNDMFDINMSSTPALRQLRITDNDFDLKYVGHAIGSNREIIVAYNVGFTGNSSKVEIYSATGALENSYFYSARLTSAPKFSPDAQTYGLNVEVQSGQLGVPSTLQTFFFARSTGNSVAGFSGTILFDWLPDGRLALGLLQGIVIFPSLSNTSNGTLIPNTQTATTFSVSPLGNKVAFVARPGGSGQAPRQIYMVDIDGNNSRQVTTTRTGQVVQAVFSPNGGELLLRNDACPSGVVFVDAGLIQIIPSNAATTLDVTDSDKTYALATNDRTSVCTSAPISWR